MFYILNKSKLVSFIEELLVFLLQKCWSSADQMCWIRGKISITSCASKNCRCVFNWKKMYPAYARSITMLLALDNCRVLVAIEWYSPAKAYLNINGSKWHSNPSNKTSEFTSACFYSFDHQITKHIEGQY